jgi:hypothetical protein
MKLIIPIAIGSITTSLLLAQGLNYVSSTIRPSKYMMYNPSTTPPPMGLAAAYMLAQTTIGNGTNTFYCVAANCIEMTNGGYTGWTFTYANTNGQRGRVNVYFDGQTGVVARQGEVLIQR